MDCKKDNIRLKQKNAFLIWFVVKMMTRWRKLPMTHFSQYGQIIFEMEFQKKFWF